jgi:hypothetical protein
MRYDTKIESYEVPELLTTAEHDDFFRRASISLISFHKLLQKECSRVCDALNDCCRHRQVIVRTKSRRFKLKVAVKTFF